MNPKEMNKDSLNVIKICIPTHPFPQLFLAIQYLVA